MKRVRARGKGFLKEQGMAHEDIDIGETCEVFLEEMEKGLAGESSSLEMIPTYIEAGKEVPLKKKVIAVDAGGTNFRVATVYFDEQGKAVIENSKVYAMPGVKAEVSKREFFGTMAGYIEDVIETSERIGLCFSYATEMLPNKDGRTISFSKEIKAPEVVGELIGENLKSAISTLGYGGEKHIVLLNDTVTTLLAGQASFEGRVFDGYIGFILGTGTNSCYVEENKNIIKNRDLDPSKSQVVNIESGGFGKAPRGSIDREFDESTMNPGVNVFEKMISGAYLGALCLRTAKRGAEAGLFSDVTAERLAAREQIETKDVSDFMCNPRGDDNPLAVICKAGDDTDVPVLLCLACELVERAAKLTAINLSSVVVKSGKGRDSGHPVCIVAEGTTFYELNSLKERVEYYLKSYLTKERGRHYEIVNIENATLVGAAIAGLTN